MRFDRPDDWVLAPGPPPMVGQLSRKRHSIERSVQRDSLHLCVCACVCIAAFEWQHEWQYEWQHEWQYEWQHEWQMRAAIRAGDTSGSTSGVCIAAFEWQCEWQYERRYVIRAAARVSDRIGAVSRVDIAWATLHSAVSLYVRARVRKDRSFIIENTHFSYEIRTSYVLPYYVWKFVDLHTRLSFLVMS